MSKDSVLQLAAEAVTQEPVVLDVDIKPSGRLHALGQKWKLKPLKKRLVIHPLNMGTLIRISSILVAIDLKMFAKGSLFDLSCQAVEKYGHDMATIIALAATNTKDKPKESLVQFVLNNFTPREMLGTMAIVLKQMDVTSFTSTIISMKGINVLARNEDEMSPTVPGEVSAES